MKKQLFKYLLAMFMFPGAATASQAQTRVYAKLRPIAVVTVKPAPPRTTYVWIGDEWTVKNGTYVQVKGYWASPRAGYVWVPGHWATEKRGDYWTTGHWKKVRQLNKPVILMPLHAVSGFYLYKI